ncbi:MAG: hypothetical protein WKG52_01795 [Variovorax sp.]
MKKVSFALGAAALLSLGALAAPAHAQYGHQGQRYPHNVIVVPAPPPPPGYYGHQPQRLQHGDRRDYRGDHYYGDRRDYRGDYYRGGRGDRDRDGVPNRYDRDRDNDGVPNRYDRRPNNPYRY